MNVFYFSSDLFANVAATSMVSLMENNKSFDYIHFYMIDDGIKEDTKKQIVDMVHNYNREIDFIPAPDPCELFCYPFKDRYQMGHSYVRMGIGSLLPRSIDRVLCLDSDTLILGNLSELWNMNMENNILAGVIDCINLKAYHKQFGLSGNEFYCNAGMFLVDLKKWRTCKIEEKIIDIIQKRNGNIFFFEQTLMNYCCRGKIAKLHPKYNTYTLFYAFDYKNLIRWRQPTFFYSKDETSEAIKAPVIVHLTRNFYMTSRPWVENCDHPLTDTYIEYKRKTPWTQLNKDNRPISQIIKYKIWHCIPQWILCTLASIVYNEIRPKMWWKNE